MVVTYGARDSRCLYEVNAPQVIHWAEVAGDPRAVSDELVAVVRKVVPTAAMVDAVADVRAVLERFEKCQAVDPDDVKPIAQDNRLWEMRIEISAFTLLIRIYETEVKDLPGQIVALRVHEKQISSNEASIRALQDAEIAIASQRWDAGRPNFWGA